MHRTVVTAGQARKNPVMVMFKLGMNHLQQISLQVKKIDFETIQL